MANDLAFRLKQMEEFFHLDYHRIKKISREAGDRIEKLEAELHHCFHRIEELQAALREIDRTSDNFTSMSYAMFTQTIRNIARKALDAE